MSEFLGIDMKTLDNFGFKFSQTGLICNVFFATWMEHCNELSRTNKAESTLGTDDSGSESKIDRPN